MATEEAQICQFEAFWVGCIIACPILCLRSARLLCVAFGCRLFPQKAPKNETVPTTPQTNLPAGDELAAVSGPKGM